MRLDEMQSQYDLSRAEVSGRGNFAGNLFLIIMVFFFLGIAFDYSSWNFAHAWNDYWIPFLVWIEPVTNFFGIEPNLKPYVVPDNFRLFV